MKKGTMLLMALTTVGASHMMLQLHAQVQNKENGQRQPRTSNVVRGQTFTFDQLNLKEDIGPVTKQKTIDLTIPNEGVKNAVRVQFRPQSDNQLANGNVEQLIVKAKRLSEKLAHQHGLDWVKSKGQVLVEIFAGQHEPAAEEGKLAKKVHFAIEKARLNEAGPLKVKITKDGEVHVHLKKDGKLEEVARFSVLQDQ